MDREDTIEKEQAGEERARTQVLRAQETGTDYKSTMGQAAALTGGYGSSYSQAVGPERIWKSSGTLCRSSIPRPTAAIRARATR